MARKPTGGNSKAIERAVQAAGDPWDRQPGESHQAYAGFIAYRDMEQPRSLRRAATQQNYSDHTQFGEWSRQHRWQERCQHWDAEQDRIRRVAHGREVEEMSRRQAQAAAAMQVAMMEVPTALLRRMEEARRDGIDPFEDWDERELRRALTEIGRVYPAIATFERLARGLTTQNVGVDGRIEQVVDGARRMDRRDALEYLGVVGGDDEALADMGLTAEELDGDVFNGTATEIEPGSEAS